MVEGIVINKEGNEVWVDIGSDAKIREEMGVILYMDGEVVKHPVTGKSSVPSLWSSEKGK